MKATITKRYIHALNCLFDVQYCESKSANYAILIPPSRDQQGTMYNPIINMLFEIFIRRGWNVLRFNFTEDMNLHMSTHAKCLSEINCVTDWYMQNKAINKNKFIVAGYGFGALMALETLMRRPEINGFIAISLLGQSNNSTFLAPCPHPGLFVHGKFDNKAPLEKVQEIVKRLCYQQSAIEMQILEDDHFFRKKADLLKAILMDYVSRLEEQNSDTDDQNDHNNDWAEDEHSIDSDMFHPEE